MRLRERVRTDRNGRNLGGPFEQALSRRRVRAIVAACLAAIAAVGCGDDAGRAGSGAVGECVSASTPPTPPTPPTLLEAVVPLDPLCRSRLLADALDGLGRDGVPAALEFLAEHHVLVDYASLDLILGWSARIEPERANAALESLPGRRRRPAQRVVYEHWAEVDPEAAAADLGSTPRHRQLEGSALSIAQGWERSGQPGLAAFIAKQRIEMIRSEILETVLMRRMLRGGAESVREWVAGTRIDAAGVPQSFRVEAHAVGATIIASASIEDARDWAEQIEDPNLERAAVTAVAIEWVEHEPSAAMGWVMARPDESVRDLASKEAYEAFAKRDRRAAIQWFDAQGSDDALAPMLEGYIRQLAEVDAGAAMARLHEIEGERERSTLMRSIFVQWRARDARAADEWLSSAGVSDETRRVLTQTARRRSGL